MTVETNYLLEPASVQYGDWVGTSAADEHQTIGHPTLDELSTLKHDEWWTVGIDVSSDDEFYVIAIDRNATGIRNYEDMVRYEAEHGEIPVTNFLVHDLSPAELVKVFTMFHVQFIHRSLVGKKLRVTTLDDLRYAGD